MFLIHYRCPTVSTIQRMVVKYTDFLNYQILNFLNFIHFINNFLQKKQKKNCFQYQKQFLPQVEFCRS